MKLAGKFLLVLSVVAFAVLAASGWLGARWELEQFELDMAKDHELLGRTLALPVERQWPEHGLLGAQALLRAEARADALNLRVVQLGAPEGSPLAPRLPRLAADAQSRPRAARSGAALGRQSYVTYVPLHDDYALEIAEPLGTGDELTRSRARRFGLTVLVLFATFAASAFALGLVLVGRPVRSLVLHARRIGAGDYSPSGARAQSDEIGELAAELDKMAAHVASANRRAEREHDRRLATLQQLRHADRLTTVGQLASGLAHELGTPLNVVLGRARLIEEDAAALPDVVRGARVIAEQTDRMTSLIRQLLDFARRGAPKKTATDLRELAEKTATLLGPLAARKRARLSLAGEDRLVAELDASLVQQVLMNLVMNAVHATPRGGEVRIELSTASVTPPVDVGGPAATFARIAVADDGPGVLPENLERIFEPFFTTKDVGEGTGLGLSVSYGIVRDHGGWIRVENGLERGVTFAVFLPLGVER